MNADQRKRALSLATDLDDAAYMMPGWADKDCPGPGNTCNQAAALLRELVQADVREGFQLDLDSTAAADVQGAPR